MTPTRLLAALAAASLAAGLAGCASSPKNPARTAKNVDMLYPLQAAPETDKVALGIHADGLSAAQTEALKALADRRRDTDGDAVELSTPKGADPAAAASFADAARAVLAAAGVKVTVTAYDGDAKAPLLVSYTALKAKTNRCDDKWGDLTHTRDNNVYESFGCSITANMAAQIAYPSDIVRPRAEGPADGQRRATVLEAYEAGRDTGAKQDPSKSSVISNAVQ